MKIICKYSGVTITSPSFEGWTLKDAAHPVMLMSRTELLSHTTALAGDTLNEQQETIYFISLLKSTQLVTFFVPAQPDYKLVASTIESVVKLLIFIERLGYDSPDMFRFPSFAVTSETASLKEIRAWLEECHELRKDWVTGSARDSLRRSIMEAEIAFDKLIKSPYDVASMDLRHVKIMLRWAFAASGTPAQHRERWTKIISATRQELQYIPKQEVEDMIEFMQLNLEAEVMSESGTRYHFFINYLKKQLKLQAAGIWGSLLDIETAEAIAEFTTNPGQSRIRTFLFSNSEAANALAAPLPDNPTDSNKAINTAFAKLFLPEEYNKLSDVEKQRIHSIKYGPRLRPQKSDFVNSIDFVKMLSKYMLRQSALKEFGLEGSNIYE